MTTHSWGESPLGIDDDFDDNDIIGYKISGIMIMLLIIMTKKIIKCQCLGL